MPAFGQNNVDKSSFITRREIIGCGSGFYVVL